MQSFHRSPLLVLASTMLLLATTTGAVASPSGTALARSSSATMNRLTISITTTGSTAWGKVSVRYVWQHKTGNKTCSGSTCMLRIPRGATVHLRESATNSATWPFSEWHMQTSHGTKTLMGASIHFPMQGAVTVTAVYVVAQSGGYQP